MALFAQGSQPYLLLAFAVSAGTLGLGLRFEYSWLVQASIAPIVVLAFFVWFFRDPDRVTAAGLCSPADGKVVRVDEVHDVDLGPCDRIAIFMSPLDVHVNRAPMAGNLVSVDHIKGGHVPAFNKDSDRNERVITHISAPQVDLKVIQIAGAVARRIVPYYEAGATVEMGQRIGLIRLGSRCDVLVPKGRITWKVALGEKVKAGSTSLASWRRQ